MSGIYILHFCKDRSCNAAWLDEDLLKSRKPPTWKYCGDCVRAGHKNPPAPPKDYRRYERLKEGKAKANGAHVQMGQNEEKRVG